MNEKDEGGIANKYNFSDNIIFFVKKLFSLLHNATYFSNSNIDDLSSLNRDLLNIMTMGIYSNTFKISINPNDVIINVNKPYVI